MNKKEEEKVILPDKNSSENATALGGVDQATLDKVNSTFTGSSTQTQAQGKANNQLTKYEGIANKDSIVSGSTWNTINQNFKTPTAVTEADAYLKGQLSKIQSGKTSYSDSIREMMDKITNRDKFSYDVDNDPLFQQALASAMNSGRSAMQDTIGQASALTGGYGSSYATSAGNQAYNAFVEDAYNNLPQYYQMALEAYNAEGEDMYRQLDMYNTADATEYGRMLNAYDATGTYRDRLYNEAYQQFRDSKSDAFASANLQISEHGQLSNDAFNLYNAYANEADKMYEREYQKWSDEVDNAMQYAQILNSDYWSQTNFDEGVRQFEQNFAEEQRQFDTKLENDNYWNQQEMDYKNNALAEDKRQFDEKLKFDEGQATKDWEYKYASLAKQDEWNKNELGYKYTALKQDQTQFEASQAAKAAEASGNGEDLMSAEEMRLAGNSTSVKNFIAGAMTENEFGKRGMKATIGGKARVFDNYDDYISALVEDKYNNGKGSITENQAAYLLMYYGLGE